MSTITTAERRVRVDVPPATLPAPRTDQPLTGTVKVTPLLAALNAADRVAPTWRPAVPILAGALLTAGGGILTVTKFDYERVYQESIPAPGMTGTAVLPARLLLDCLRAIGRGGSVTFSSTKAVTTLTTGVPDTPLPKDGEDAPPVLLGAVTYRLLAMPAEDYPAVPALADAVPVVNLMVGDLTAFARPLCAVGADDTLPILTAMHVTATDGGPLRIVATDRYRLAVQTIDVAADRDVDVLVGGKTLGVAAAVLKSEPAVEFAVTPHAPSTLPRASGEWTVLRAGSRTIAWRGIDGEYPKVDSIIPTGTAVALDADADAFATQVKRAAVIAERNTPVRIEQVTGTDRLVVAAGAPVDGAVNDATDAAATADLLGVHVARGKWDTFALNPAYLLDALRQFRGHRVNVEGNQTSKPYLFTSDGVPGFQYVLMPVRLAP